MRLIPLIAFSVLFATPSHAEAECTAVPAGFFKKTFKVECDGESLRGEYPNLDEAEIRAAEEDALRESQTHDAPGEPEET